jgi:SAM-dependent methyltransferase
VASTSTVQVLRPSADEAATSWRDLVLAAGEQHRRLWEDVEVGGESFLKSRLGSFRPGANVSEELDYLLSLARPDDVWTDIGAGGGRLTVPLARVVRRVHAVDPSPTMREALATAAADAGVDSIEQHDRRWPDDAEALPVVDATLTANFLYGVAEPLPFLEAMERRSRRLCVVALSDRASRAPDEGVWLDVTGEPLRSGPGAAELAMLLLATGRRIDYHTFPAPPPRALPVDEAIETQRWRCGLRPDSAGVTRLRAAVERRAGSDGLVRLQSGRRYTGIVSWEPARA